MIKIKWYKIIFLIKLRNLNKINEILLTITGCPSKFETKLKFKLIKIYI